MYMSQYFPKNTIFYNDNKDENIYRFFILDILELFKLIQSNVLLDHMYLNHYNPNSQVDHWRVFLLSFFVNNLYISTKTDKGTNYLISYIPKKVLFFFPCFFKINLEQAVDNLQNKQIIISCIEFLNYKMVSPPSTHGGFKFFNRKHNRTVYDFETKQLIEKHLSYHNMECVYIEDLSPYYQIEFCRNASVLIAPHGAGLTNLIFTSPNCLICEIHIKDQPETDYCKLCKILNKKYVRYDVDDIVPHEIHPNYLVLHKRLLRIIQENL